MPNLTVYDAAYYESDRPHPLNKIVVRLYCGETPVVVVTKAGGVPFESVAEAAAYGRAVCELAQRIGADATEYCAA